MNEREQPIKKTIARVCSDLKTHLKTAPRVDKATKQTVECSDNVCSLTDWKPRKQSAA